MRLLCHGARGSIPVSGKEFVRYGGDTTCLELQVEGATFIVDAGTGLRRLGKKMEQEGRLEAHLLLTHTHWDHILGFPFFRLLYHPEASITIYGCKRRQGAIARVLPRSIAAPHFPVPYSTLAAHSRFEPLCAEDEPVRLGPLEVRTIPLSHPNMGQGFRFNHNGASLVFLTDNELGHRHRGGSSFKDYAAFSAGADLLIHDAEYRSEEYAATKGYGHSTCDSALELALEAGVRRFGLFHHNQDRSDSQIDAMVEHCNREVQRRGGQVQCFALAQDQILDI